MRVAGKGRWIGKLENYAGFVVEMSKTFNSLLQVPLTSHMSTEDLSMSCIVGVASLTN